MIQRLKFEAMRAPKKLWEMELKISIDDGVWENMNENTFKMIGSTKLQYFQYRLTNRIITTNLRRAKWDPDIDPKCTFCREELETSLHIFYECKQVKLIWEAFKVWLKKKGNISWEIESNSILFPIYISRAKKRVN